MRRAQQGHPDFTLQSPGLVGVFGVVSWVDVLQAEDQVQAVVPGHVGLLEFRPQAGHQGHRAVFQGHAEGLNCRLKAPLPKVRAQLCTQAIGLIGRCVGELNAAFQCLEGKPGGRTIHGTYFAPDFARFFLGITPNFHGEIQRFKRR